MFKFIVQAPNLDEAVVKLKELTSRLEDKAFKTSIVKDSENRTIKAVVTVSEEDNEEEFTPENMIGKTLSQPSLDVSGELDAEGIPWDARIHSSGKSKYKKDNTWTLKRGVTDEEAAKIKAEYKHVDVVGLPTQGMTSSPVQVAQPIVQAAPIAQPTVVTPPPALPTMSSGHTVDTFKANFPLILGNLITEGKVTQEYINQLKDYFKVTEIWMINDEQKANLFESFVGYGLVTKVG